MRPERNPWWALFLVLLGLSLVGRADEVETDRDTLGFFKKSRAYPLCAKAGARVINFEDEHSFAALWTPTNFRSGRIMILLPGTGGTPYEGMKDELSLARKYDYMVAGVQWRDRDTQQFFDAETVYRLVDRTLRHAAAHDKADLSKVALSGFSRGGAISYEVAWLDAQSNRYFKLIIAHSGGVPLDAVVAPRESRHPGHFFSELNAGKLGPDAMKGCNFFLYSGDKDEQWGGKMSEKMENATKVLPLAGANVVEWVRDPNGGHMGYFKTPEIHEKAIRHFIRLTGGESESPNPKPSKATERDEHKK
jgi:predicted esterase